MYESQTPLVLDNGSGLCKIGFSATDAPKACFTSIVGKPRIPSALIGTEQKGAYVGDEAQSRRGVLNMSYPMTHGIITSWEDIEKLWAHAFLSEMRTAPDDHPLIITEASLNPKQNREQMTQVFFEKFSISAFYVGNQARLSLYSSGKVSGLVLYSGDGVTHADPIFEGYALSRAVERVDLGGRDVTDALARLLAAAGVGLLNSAEREIVRDLKEKHAYVSQDYHGDCANESRTPDEYVLPDDNVISLTAERFMATELMFHSEIFGMELPGVDQIVLSAIGKSDLEFRKYLSENIVLSGGNTMHEGFAERLNAEISEKIEETQGVSACVKVRANSERKFAPWLGASILSALNSFQQLWVTKSEYEEQGARVIHTKCPS
jgi:actin-related protein